MAKEKTNMGKWLKPQTKVRRVYKIEEDGTKTTARVLDMTTKAVIHSEDGPALIYDGQKRKEFLVK